MHKEQKGGYKTLPTDYDESRSPMENLRKAVKEALPYADEYLSTVIVGARFGEPHTYKKAFFRAYRPAWQRIFADLMSIEEAAAELQCDPQRIEMFTKLHIGRWIEGMALMEVYRLNEDLRIKLKQQKERLVFLSEEKVKERLGQDMDLFMLLMSVKFSKTHFGKRYVLPKGYHRGFETVIRNVPKVMIRHTQPLDVSRIKVLMDWWELYADVPDMDETIRIFLENEEWIEKTDDEKYIARLEKNEYIASILNT